MKYIIRTHFDAAHKLLPPYEGPCCNLHGHTWNVDFVFRFSKEDCDVTGMCVDFKILKRFINDILPDHQYLNQTFPGEPPTAENLAAIFYKQIRERLKHNRKLSKIAIQNVVVWESTDCGVVFEDLDA